MRPLRFAFKPVVGILSALCLVNQGLGAPSPREELLRLVPPNAGFCLIVNDLRGHADSFRHSAWFKQLQQSPLWELVARSPEAKKFERFLEHDLPATLQIDWPRLRDDILGDAAVFAYRPRHSGQTEQESGLFLLWARDGQLLAALVKRLNQVQLDNGEIKAVRELTHRGKTYFERTEQKGQTYVYWPVNTPMQTLPVTVPVPVLTHSYYFLNSHLLAFSSEREQLLRVLEKAGLPMADGTETPLMAGLARAGADRSLAALWLNPRAFDADIQQHTARASSDEAQGLNAFRPYWQALDAVVLSLEMRLEPQVQLSVQGRPEALPAAARQILTTAAKPSDLWGRFPSDSILTVALRVDALALKNAVAEFLMPEARKLSGTVLQQTLGAALGMNLATDVLPNLGPDVGFCVAAPAEKTGFPHLFAAVRVRPGTKTAHVDTALLKAMRFFASLAVFDHNRRTGDRVRMETAMQGDVEVSFLAGGSMLPAGLQPAMALKGGYLLWASTPEAIRRFRAEPGELPRGADSPLLRFSISSLVAFLQSRQEPIADFLSAQNYFPRETTRQWLGKSAQTLTLFDRFEVTQRPGQGQLLLTMRLHTSPKR
jgi:hypothetical protein